MTTDARESITAAILSRNGTFTAANITEITGLRRQLVFKYLQKYTEKGWLEKYGAVYFAIDKEALVQQLLLTKQSDPGRFEQTDYWLSSSTLLLCRETTNLIIMARALNLTDSAAMKTAMIEELDKSIKSLIREKKYLATGKRSPSMVAKSLRKGYLKTFKVNGKETTLTFDEATFINHLYTALGNVMDSFTIGAYEAKTELIKKIEELAE